MEHWRSNRRNQWEIGITEADTAEGPSRAGEMWQGQKQPLNMKLWRQKFLKPSQLIKFHRVEKRGHLLPTEQNDKRVHASLHPIHLELHLRNTVFRRARCIWYLVGIFSSIAIHNSKTDVSISKYLEHLFTQTGSFLWRGYTAEMFLGCLWFTRFIILIEIIPNAYYYF